MAIQKKEFCLRFWIFSGLAEMNNPKSKKKSKTRSRFWIFSGPSEINNVESKKKVLRGHVGLILEVFTWIRGPQSVHLDSEAREIIIKCIQKKAGNRFWIVRLSREINSAIQKKELTGVAS